MNKIKEIILNTSLLKRLIVVFLLCCFMIFGMHSVILKPYLIHYNSLQGELRAQQNLLALKLKRTGSLPEFENKYLKMAKELAVTNQYYFTETELDLLMNQLPKIISKTGNKLISIDKQSVYQQNKLQIIKKYILDLDLANQKAIFEFLDKHQDDINLENKSDIRTKFLKMIPRNKKAKLRNLWYKTKTDPLLKIKTQKVTLEIVLQGSYKGLLYLFKWFDKQKKIIKLNEIAIAAMQVNSAKIEAGFNLTIYKLID